MLAFALNEIHLKRDEAVVVQAPREVFECASKKQFDELLALGSIRVPTDAEQALYGLTNRSRAPAPAKAPPAAPVKTGETGETAAQRKKREAAEAAAAEAAAADAEDLLKS